MPPEQPVAHLAVELVNTVRRVQVAVPLVEPAKLQTVDTPDVPMQRQETKHVDVPMVQTDPVDVVPVLATRIVAVMVQNGAAIIPVSVVMGTTHPGLRVLAQIPSHIVKVRFVKPVLKLMPRQMADM